MWWYLGILALAIFVSGSLMSWGHTATFFAENGFGKGYDPYLGVGLVEALFLMGAGAEIYMRKTGQKSTWSIKLALWIGGAVVFWANLRYGLAYGWEGVVAGSIIIVAILIAENVLADIVLAIQRDRENSRAEVENSISILEDQVEMEAKFTSGHGEVENDSPSMLEVEGGVEEKPPHYIGDMEKSSTLEVENVERKVEGGDGNLHVSTMGKMENAEKRVEAPSPVCTSDVENMEKVETSTLQADRKVESESRKMEEDIPRHLEVEKLENEKKSSLHLQGGDKKDSPSSTSRKKSAGKSSTSTLETGSTIVYSPGADPLEVAMEIMKVEKKRPGRPRLMKAGMSEHTAKMTAKKLEKIEKKVS